MHYSCQYDTYITKSQYIDVRFDLKPFFNWRRELARADLKPFFHRKIDR